MFALKRERLLIGRVEASSKQGDSSKKSRGLPDIHSIIHCTNYFHLRRPVTGVFSTFDKQTDDASPDMLLHTRISFVFETGKRAL